MLVTATPCVSRIQRPPECGARIVTGIYRRHHDPVSADASRRKQRPDRACSGRCLVAAVLKSRPHWTSLSRSVLNVPNDLSAGFCKSCKACHPKLMNRTPWREIHLKQVSYGLNRLMLVVQAWHCDVFEKLRLSRFASLSESVVQVSDLTRKEWYVPTEVYWIACCCLLAQWRWKMGIGDDCWRWECRTRPWHEENTARTTLYATRIVNTTRDLRNRSFLCSKRVWRLIPFFTISLQEVIITSDPSLLFMRKQQWPARALGLRKATS